MSEIRDLINAIIQERDPVFGDDVINLRTGLKIRAEVYPVTDIELNEAMGRDSRESIIFQVFDDTQAAGIILNDILVVYGNRFQVLRRTDNPAQAQTEFAAMKLTAKDQ